MMPSIPKKLVMFDIDHIASVFSEFVTFAPSFDQNLKYAFASVIFDEV